MMNETVEGLLIEQGWFRAGYCDCCWIHGGLSISALTKKPPGGCPRGSDASV